MGPAHVELDLGGQCPQFAVVTARFQLPLQRPARDRVARLHEGFLEGQKPRHALDQETVAVDEVEASARLCLG